MSSASIDNEEDADTRRQFGIAQLCNSSLNTIQPDFISIFTCIHQLSRISPSLIQVPFGSSCKASSRSLVILEAGTYMLCVCAVPPVTMSNSIQNTKTIKAQPDMRCLLVLLSWPLVVALN